MSQLVHADGGGATPVTKDPLYVRAPLAQRLPQAPQVDALEARSTSQPFPALPSQLTKPGLQAATARRYAKTHRPQGSEHP